MKAQKSDRIHRRKRKVWVKGEAKRKRIESVEKETGEKGMEKEKKKQKWEETIQ